MKQFNISRL